MEGKGHLLQRFAQLLHTEIQTRHVHPFLNTLAYCVA
jgi:hypothetical protein